MTRGKRRESGRERVLAGRRAWEKSGRGKNRDSTVGAKMGSVDLIDTGRLANF
jgi:hypothetical protein